MKTYRIHPVVPLRRDVVAAWCQITPNGDLIFGRSNPESGWFLAISKGNWDFVEMIGETQNANSVEGDHRR